MKLNTPYIIKSILFVYILMAVSSSNANAVIKVRPKKVLFIGNSLTFYNNMPQTVQKMCDEQKTGIKIDQYTNPGWQLIDHVSNVPSYAKDSYQSSTDLMSSVGVKKILSNNWDIVVLQDGGGFTLIPEYCTYSFEPCLIFLDSVIKSRKCLPVLYQMYATDTYPCQLCDSKYHIEQMAALYRKEDKVQIPMKMDYQYCSPNFNNSTEEFAAFKNEYNKMSKKLGIDLVKVGYAFELIKKNHPEIPMYFAYGDSHPSPQGSYLIACLFYKYITKRNVVDIKYDANVDSKQAAIIRALADTIN